MFHLSVDFPFYPNHDHFCHPDDVLTTVSVAEETVVVETQLVFEKLEVSVAVAVQNAAAVVYLRLCPVLCLNETFDEQLHSRFFVALPHQPVSELAIDLWHHLAHCCANEGFAGA